jgi:thiosulfate/3-mercaptopyruvate sulfurtransferase
MNWLKSVTIAAVGLMLAAAPALASTWIDIDAAKSRIATGGDLVIIDARGAKDYAAGHITGAVNAPWQSFSDMKGKPGDANWGTVLPAERLGEAIGKLGIKPGTQVLVYAAPPGGWGEDGRVAWTLIMAGVEPVAIIEGGIEAWKAAGGAVSTEAPTITPVSFTVASTNLSMNASKDDVKASLSKAVILDSRTPQEYEGAQKFGERRGGHLPGAISLPWTSVFDENGRLSSPDALKKMLDTAGIGENDEIISYCTKGIRSAHMTLVLRDLGYANARNYDASFHEWAGDDSLPLEK